MKQEILNKYYQNIINLISEIYYEELLQAKPGHCMKITGLPNERLYSLWEHLTYNFKHIDTFIIDDEKSDNGYISATKLIELRNKQDNPLLILLPSNSRTAAEDSYGNATFKEISLNNVDTELLKRLRNNVPKEFKNTIKDVLKYVSPVDTIKVINYLIAIEIVSYTKESIGGNLYLLGLLPDTGLLAEDLQLQYRLNLNKSSCSILTDFSKSIYDRVDELKIQANTLQRDFIELFRTEKDVLTVEKLAERIYADYENLWFNNWVIPELDFGDVKLEILQITSNNFEIENGSKFIVTTENKNAKIKIRFQTNPALNFLSDVRFFRALLMRVDGGRGEEVQSLKKVGHTTIRRNYKDITIDLDPNVIEEDSYFIKIHAEDEFGNIINTNDDFYDDSIQSKWKELGGTVEAKSELDFKLKCDSEDFYFQVDESIEPDEKLRKDKLNNVLQATLKYNLERLRSKEGVSIPEPSDFSNVWLNDDKPKINSIFHINYPKKHNYQIIISSKLRQIENEFLKNGSYIGHIEVVLNRNSKKPDLDSVVFVPSELGKIVPQSLLNIRASLFEEIKNSNDKRNGVFETANILQLKETIRQYVLSYNQWLGELKEKINDYASIEEKTQLHFAEVQFLDTVKVKTKLPDDRTVNAILLSPLHPLRLTWFLSLIEKFEDWYNRTLEYDKYLDSWGELESLFLGELNPSNNPYVFVDPNQFTNYEYLGELCYGWGVYVDTSKTEKEDSLVPISYQVKHYLKHLFNIDSSNVVNNELSKSLVVRHLKNYLLQHPYTETLIINLFNVGDAKTFADSFVELNKFSEYVNTKFEIRIFIGQESIIEHGLALKHLINPETNTSEEAELFSQPSKNRLFPKLRFSINNINQFIENPLQFNAHISFLVNPFPAKTSLYKPLRKYKASNLSGLIIDSNTEVETNTETEQLVWNNFVLINSEEKQIVDELYNSFQYFTSGSLAINSTDSLPSTQLSLDKRDMVLLSHLHEYSDWVITFDKNLGPQIFDQPSETGKVPYLLDYIPGEEISRISSYLTTKPSSEIRGLLSPHFEEFGISSEDRTHLVTIQTILEDIRAVSSSLLLQLNSSRTRAFEAIGIAFSKRVLEKKGLLKNAFIIPIDLHKNLFEDTKLVSKSRADNVIVSIDPETRTIKMSILEIKCRTYLSDSEREDLKVKILDQINNTIEAVKYHFDANEHLSQDRLDREIKNKELRSLLEFYIERAYRYNLLDVNSYNTYTEFIQTLNNGFEFEFNKLGFIFDFSFLEKHQKQTINEALTIFTFGKSLINEILDKESDLNTNRLEEKVFDEELLNAFKIKDKLKPFILKYSRKTEKGQNEEDSAIEGEQNDNVVSPPKGIKETEAEIEETTTITEEEEESQIQVKAESELPESKSNLPYFEPEFDIFIGKDKPTEQYGILGTSIHGKHVAIDLSGVNTISLFGVPGGGKSYTIGTISEMVLKQYSKINKLASPLAGVIFHYNESMEYEPEFTSMIYPNSKEKEIQKLREIYSANPDNIEDVVILTPKDKVDERQAEFPSLEVHGISFNSNELNVQDWLFLLGAVGNDSVYIRQLKFMMRELRNNITLDGLRESVEESELLSASQKALARQRLNFAGEYINDDVQLNELLKPGRLIIVDLRDEFIVKDEALGLFVIMLNIFSGVRNYENKHFNKFIVFDEAHKYMDNRDLTGTIVTSIREMRHKGVNIMIASQDPPSLPIDIIELSSILVLHKFTSPGWLKHIKKSNSSMENLSPSDMSMLKPGEAFIWAKEATDATVTVRPLKISTRSRVTMHGGSTKQAL